MKKLVLLSAISFWLAACDTQVKNFVEAASSTPPPLTPGATTSGTGVLKISPGSLTGQSAGMGITATVTPTEHRMTSASMGMTVGISKVTTQ